MKYVVMNRNSLEGYQKGYFQDIPPCFYEGHYRGDNDTIMQSWTPVLGLARTFDTEAEAWDFVKATWGLKFSFTNYLIISVHQEALDRSFEHRDKILEMRYSNG